MNAYVVDGVRTPRGKGRPGGALSHVPPVRLLADLIVALSDRLELDPARVDDLRIGCAVPTGEQGTNVARLAAILAGMERAGGVTVSRGCCSGLDAIASAAASVSASMESLIVAGGVESMSRVPMFSDQGPWFSDPDVADATGFIHMAVAADLLATLEGIDADALHALALESHRRAAAARDGGRFTRSLVPVDGVGADEAIRDDLDLDALRAAPRTFETLADADAMRRIHARYPGLELAHRHCSRTAPALADAASALLIASERGLEALARPPRARVLAWAHVGVEPTRMLDGNVEATRQALARAGLGVDDVDRFEINESFAVVPVHFARSLDVPPERLNVDGGAIAMGHPLGATGGILVVTLLDALERAGGRYGVAAVCGAAGVATALVVERLDA